MDYGHLYYQSPLDAYINGIDSTTPKTISIDGNSGSFSILDLNNKDNIQFRNLYFHNTGTSYYIMAVSNNPHNIVFKNCKFADSIGIGNYSAGIYGWLMDDCYFNDDLNSGTPNYRLAFPSAYGASHLLRCVFKLSSTLSDTRIYYWHFQYCLFAGGKVAIGYPYYNFVTNCIFYNQTEQAIKLNSVSTKVIVQDSIFLLAGTSDRVIEVLSNGGSVIRFDHSCYWSLGGALTSPFYSIKDGSEFTPVGIGSISADPQFVDADNGDFRPRNPAVLRGGKPDINGNPTQIGAVLQGYQFAKRARTANLGRLQIFR